MKKVALLWMSLIATPLAAQTPPVQDESAPAAAPTVTSLPLSQLAIFREFSAPAAVISARDTVLSAEIAGRIDNISAKVGDTVEPGAVLVNLNCRDYSLQAERIRTQIKGAEVRAELASRQLKRARSLKSSKNASQELLDQRSFDLDSAQVEKRELQVALEQAANTGSKCAVKAPFGGVVLERNADLGELAMPGTPLLRIMDTNSLEVSAQLLTQDIPHIQEQKQIVFDAAGKRLPVSVRSVVPLVNTLSRNQEVRLSFLESATTAGTAGRILWRDPQPYLPAELVVRRQQGLGVFLDQNGIARFVPLPQAQEGRPVRVDLPGNSQIIVEGRYLLKDGQATR